MGGTLAIFLFLLRSLSPVEGLSVVEGLPPVEGPVVLQAHQPDTLKASVVSSTYGSIVPPQRITSREMEAAGGVADAVRRFAGVQLRDYGGVGGMKTVNVRSLGSEHTGVFIDGIQVDNAQNMQVDLGRFGTDDIRSASLFSGQKISPLQAAKEYSSASALYLESSGPVFNETRNNLSVGLKGGSFGTISPKISWEHLFGEGVSARLSGQAVSSDGRYRFHVSDWRSYPDGTFAGYDTTMTRMNCDLRSVRLDGRLFGPSWDVHAYYYDSERGLPGPVYKRAGEYPLSEDRQSDRDVFVQGRFVRSLGGAWSLSGRGKLSFSHLEYVDFPELRPDLSPARFNYRNHSAYLSASAMAVVSPWLKVNLAQDFQYDYLDADLVAFAYPGRFSSWSAASLSASAGTLQASASMLYLGVRDTFLSGGGRSSAGRRALMPSLVLKWKFSQTVSLDAFAKRSYRMPTFNDLYYTTVGTKTLEPEDARQLDLGASFALPGDRDSQTLLLKADVYYNQLKNKIIAVPTSNQFRWSMYNIGVVDVLGADLTAACSRTFGKVVLGANGRYTYQRARTGEGGQVPYIPVHSGSVNVFGELAGWRADVTFFATGERYTTSVNLPAYRLAPWCTLDAAISKSFKVRTGTLALRLSASNLLDEQYEIVDNYPMPGANGFLTVEYSF